MFILLPASLLFALGAVLVFLWATRSGQYDDLDSPAARILDDDDKAGSGLERGHTDKS
jgi:cbb3-type cytochrome oxidase maturation protein